MIGQGLKNSTNIHTLEFFIGNNPLITNEGLKKITDILPEFYRLRNLSIGLSGNCNLTNQSL